MNNSPSNRATFAPKGSNAALKIIADGKEHLRLEQKWRERFAAYSFPDAGELKRRICEEAQMLTGEDCACLRYAVGCLEHREKAAEWFRGRMLPALLSLTKGEGEAARLARGAYADIMNLLDADNQLEALDVAFKAANGAARAYFIEHGKCDGKPQRRHTPKELVEAGRGILAKMGLNPNKSGQIEGLLTAEVKARFGRRLMEARLWTDTGDADLPERLLTAIYDADRRAAKRKRKPH